VREGRPAKLLTVGNSSPFHLAPRSTTPLPGGSSPGSMNCTPAASSAARMAAYLNKFPTAMIVR